MCGRPDHHQGFRRERGGLFLLTAGLAGGAAQHAPDFRRGTGVVQPRGPVDAGDGGGRGP